MHPSSLLLLQGGGIKWLCDVLLVRALKAQRVGRDSLVTSAVAACAGLESDSA